MAHALLSPSSAHRWMNCPASVAMERDYLDGSSEHAAEGAAAHFLAEYCLGGVLNTWDLKGLTIAIDSNGTATWDPSLAMRPAFSITVDDEMAENVQKYVDAVRDYARHCQVVDIEKRVDYSHVTGIPNSFGTCDALIITDDGELQVHDLKYGRGVKVSAEQNEQLMIYTLGALEEYALVCDISSVRLVIHQPRLQSLSEWTCTVEELQEFAQDVKTSAALVMGCVVALAHEGSLGDSLFNPGEKTCQWCKHKANCAALAQHVSDTVGCEFDDITETIVMPSEDVPASDLSVKMKAVDLIEDWCKAVRAEVERRLLAGKEVANYKLVEGRKGARKWGDEETVEKTLKAMRIKREDMYEYSLISPTTAEKLHKSGVIGDRQWPKIQDLITQSSGKPSVAHVSDKRPAIVITPTAEEFDDLTAGDLV